MSIPKTSVLNRTVSAVSSFNSTDTIDVNLFAFLTSTKYKPQIEKIRATDNKSVRDELKARLPAVMISGRFSQRGQKHLIEHSGLISFDLDNVRDIAEARLKIQQLPFVAYLSLSASGKGLFGIIPILYADKHKEHFNALAIYFKDNSLPELDPSPSNVASLRGYSYDDQAYVNHDAQSFTLTYNKPKPKPQSITPYTSNNGALEEFNLTYDVDSLVTNHGWILWKIKDNEWYYTRPGKDCGKSATFFTDTKKFYVFTSSSCFEANSTHDAFSLYRILECGGDYGLCYKTLREQGLLKE